MNELRKRAKEFCDKDEWPGQSLEDACYAFASEVNADLLAENERLRRGRWPWTPEETARRFYELYESLAPSLGYKTREASAVPWEQVPEPNKQLMLSVTRNLITEALGDNG